jgi:hypothetical protein
MGFRGILTRKEAFDMMDKGEIYLRKVPVKAVQLTSKVSLETRTGQIENGKPGDYLVQDVTRPEDFWIIRREVFESEFERAETK